MFGRFVFELGCVTYRSTRHVLAKNLTQVAVSSLLYYSVGHSLSLDAYGGFYGTKPYLMQGESQLEFSRSLLSFICCWHCVSIASASLSERTFSGTHTFVTVFVSGILFPVAASWVWGQGWLQKMGFIDYSGAAAVHLLGGIIGLIGTLSLKPRLG